MKLTYNYLGDDIFPTVGNPLGVDYTGWPYRIVSLSHNEDKTKSYIEIELWDIPDTEATPQDRIDFDAALLYARYLTQQPRRR